MTTAQTVAIIGAGPAGLMAAYWAAQSNKRVLLFDKNARIGGKLAIAGGGMCNYSHALAAADYLTRYGVNGRALKFALKAFDYHAAMTFFKSFGTDSIIRADNKIFPQSLQATDIVACFERALDDRNIEIITQTAVIAIVQEQCWKLTTTRGQYSADKLVIATGGASFGHIGTTGDAYPWFRQLGLDVVKLKPALNAISVADDHADLAGISIPDISVSVVQTNGVTQSVSGDLLFTHKGYSGPVILDCSRYLSVGAKLIINWLNRPSQQFEEALISASQQQGKQQVLTWLEKLALPKRVVQMLLRTTGLAKQTKMAELSKAKRGQIVQAFCAYRVNNPQVAGFKTAMATAGGLALSELNHKYFNIKKHPSIYAIGETVDLDGDTGGFNIQAALSMGYLAGRHIAKF